MKSIIWIIIVVILFESCKTNINDLSNSRVLSIDEFPISKVMHGDTLNIEIIGLNELFVVDTFLLGFNYLGNVDFIKVFNLKNKNYLGALVKKGKGPKEFLTVQYNGQYEKDDTDCYIWISDVSQSNKCLRVNVNKSIEQNDLLISNELKFNNIDYPSTVFIINDSIASFIQLYEEGMHNIYYTLVNTKNNSTITKRKIYENEIIENKENYNWYLAAGIKPDRTQIVAYGNDFSRLHVFSTNFDNVKTLNVGEYRNDHLNSEVDPLLKRCYYYDIALTNKHIFALMVNKNINDILDAENQSGAKIHVFDWTGSAVAELVVSENLMHIDIDTQEGYIYGTRSDEKVFIYNLKKQNLF